MGWAASASGIDVLNERLTECSPWKVEANLRHTRDLVFSISRDHVHVCSFSIFDETFTIDHGQNGPQAHLLNGE